MYKNLTDYIGALERAGELARVRVPVDPQFEIAELTDRESKRPGGGRALLFENTGTAFPVLTNMMGSDRRIAMALGVERLGELTERIDALFGELTSPKPSLMDKLRMLPVLEKMSRWLPRNRGGRGACQQVVLTGEEARLSLLPVLRCWPHDGGRFVTLPLVNTVDPDSGVRNVGMYRMQILSEHTTGMHWHLHKTGERHYRRYAELGRRMPVAVCLGGDPAYTYAATAPMPDNMDEYLLAGFLRRRPVELVRCLTSDLRVPGDCDFVIEGYVDPAEPKTTEGTFRRPYRFLFARRRLSGVPRHGRYAPPGRGLSGDDRRRAAAGGRLHRQGYRKDFPRADPPGYAFGGQGSVYARAGCGP